MGYETITFGIENDIARITLNRPDVLNSLNAAMMVELRTALAVTRRARARALLMTGTGRGFCAGADISRPVDQPDTENLAARGERVSRSMETLFNPLVRDLYELDIPKVAAVNGIAAGGGVSLALATDIVVAAHSACFVLVFAPRLGIVPDLGSTWHLPRLVGRARARGLVLLGDRLDATTAAEWGLIWKAVDDDALVQTADALATRLRDGPTAALARAGRLLDESLHASFADALESEREAQRVLTATAEHSEGIAAFNEKRPPLFYRRKANRPEE